MERDDLLRLARLYVEDGVQIDGREIVVRLLSLIDAADPAPTDPEDQP